MARVMEIRPLGHRVLVKPDSSPTVTASGLLIPESHSIPAMSGTVVQVGNGSSRLWKAQLSAVARCMAAVPDGHYMRDIVSQVSPQPVNTVAIGDRVLFAAESGHELVLDERTTDALILLAEDDILAVLDVAA